MNIDCAIGDITCITVAGTNPKDSIQIATHLDKKNATISLSLSTYPTKMILEVSMEQLQVIHAALDLLLEKEPTAVGAAPRKR